MGIKKERVAIWDNLKFVLIFLVVFGHFIDFYTKQSINMRRIFLFVYTFHMPAFLFVSGLFSKKIVYQRNYQRIFEYFVIYVFIKIYLFVMKLFIYGTVSGFSLLNETGVPWYAFILFAYNLITICLHKLDWKYLLSASIVLACMVGYDPTISTFLMLSRIIVLYPFFLAGFYCNPNNIVEIVKKRKIQILSVVIWSGFAIIVYICTKDCYFVRSLLSGQNPYETLGAYSDYGAVFRVVYYGVAFVLIFSLISLIPQKESIISKWGKNSLQVYILHYGAIYIIMELVNKVDFLNNLIGNIGNYWTIPVSIVVTVLFSLEFWRKLLNPFIKPKWNN